MAAGVPATGIGGIFYIILLIGIMINKLFKKICEFINLNPSCRTKISGIIRKLPTYAFILCVTVLVLMNITGFRFILFRNQGSAIQVNDLWLTGLLAISVFLSSILLINRRSKQLKPI